MVNNLSIHFALLQILPPPHLHKREAQKTFQACSAAIASRRVREGWRERSERPE